MCFELTLCIIYSKWKVFKYWKGKFADVYILKLKTLNYSILLLIFHLKSWFDITCIEFMHFFILLSRRSVIKAKCYQGEFEQGELEQGKLLLGKM